MVEAIFVYCGRCGELNSITPAKCSACGKKIVGENSLMVPYRVLRLWLVAMTAIAALTAAGLGVLASLYSGGDIGWTVTGHVLAFAFAVGLPVVVVQPLLRSKAPAGPVVR